MARRSVASWKGRVSAPRLAPESVSRRGTVWVQLSAPHWDMELASMSALRWARESAPAMVWTSVAWWVSVSAPLMGPASATLTARASATHSESDLAGALELVSA